MLTSAFSFYFLAAIYLCIFMLQSSAFLVCHKHYQGQNGDNYYYGGPFCYFTKSGTTFTHVLDKNITASSTNLVKNTISFEEYRDSIKNHRSLTNKLQELHSAKDTYSITGTISEGDLYYSLSLAWVNGYCGPTSAFAILEYMDKLRENHCSDPEDEIEYISTLTGVDVDLFSLRYGINMYLDYNNISGTAYSCNYNFNTVMSRINADTPITLGTNGGGLATGGHVQTIHGYFKETISSNNQFYVLYVNNSWGSNNIALPYEINPDSPYPPSYLKDHVYIY